MLCLYSLSIVLDDGSLLVAGGGNAYPFFATTEIVAPGMDSIPGPDMPGGPNRFHCFIKYGPTKALLIGGGTGPASIARFALDETWVFDVPTRTFLGPGPSLNTVRHTPNQDYLSGSLNLNMVCSQEETWHVE